LILALTTPVRAFVTCSTCRYRDWLHQQSGGRWPVVCKATPTYMHGLGGMQVMYEHVVCCRVTVTDGLHPEITYTFAGTVWHVACGASLILVHTH
jgi:hypothetical protein